MSVMRGLWFYMALAIALPLAVLVVLFFDLPHACYKLINRKHA